MSGAKRILIAEDDEFLANAYKAKLSSSGFDLDIAATGTDVMDKLDSFQPDAVILDLMMPKKDGFTLLSEIRAIPRWKSLPIIVATNLGQQEDIDRAMKLGANSFVIKANLSLSELTQKINDLLQSS